MATIVPTNVTQVDDKAGNHYSIFEVKHSNGTQTDVIVDDSAVSVSELPDDMVSSSGLVKETNAQADGSSASFSDNNAIVIANVNSGASGVGWNFAVDDGVKQVSINSSATSGTYKVVVRHVGSAAGMGGTHRFGARIT